MTNADAPFLRACRREQTAFTPVWLMRQAGRYLPEYRALRARYDFLTLCKTPEAAAEVTLQPIERLGVDAAILFADILLVLEPLGVGLEFTRGEGPHIARPVRSADDVARLAPVDVPSSVGFVFETVRRARKGLAESVALIRLAGAPTWRCRPISIPPSCWPGWRRSAAPPAPSSRGPRGVPATSSTWVTACTRRRRWTMCVPSWTWSTRCRRAESGSHETRRHRRRHRRIVGGPSSGGACA